MAPDDFGRLPPFISSYIEGHAGNIEATLARLDADLVRKHDSFVFKVTPEVLQAFQGSDESAEAYRKEVLSRTSKKRVHLLCFSPVTGDYLLYAISASGLEESVASPTVSEVRQLDLLSIVQAGRSYGMLQVNPGHHFISPSGHHCKQFLRVADMIHSVESLDSISYWLSSELGSCGGVIVDNWNIAPVALRAIAAVPVLRIQFDFLPGHAKSFEATTYRIVERMLGNVPAGTKVLCLTSVCSTGTNIEHLRRTFGRFGRLEDCHPLAIYSFVDAPPEIAALCKLEVASESFTSRKTCALCKQGSTAVEVDPHLFYVRTPQEKGVALRKEHLEASTLVTDYANEPGILFVHKDDPNDGRHHAMYVDVRGLLRTRLFPRRFRECLDSLASRPDVLVAPNHEAGRAMAEIASTHLKVPAIIHDDLRPENGLSAAAIAVIGRAQNLLFVDDVLITGSRFERFNCALRENAAHFGNFKNVAFLVGVGRPSSNEEWERNLIKLTKNHDWTASLSSIERIFLPYWKSSDCPWCHEYEMLSRISRKLAAPPEWITARLTELTQKQLGLETEPLFLLPKVPSRRLGSGSRVGPANLASTHTLFSLASGLQCLRHDPKPERRLYSDAMVANVFAARNLHNYSEGLIRGLLLRLVLPAEWGQTNREKAMKLLLSQLGDSTQSSLFGELLVACHRGSLSWLSEHDLAEYESELIQTMRDLLKEMT